MEGRSVCTLFLLLPALVLAQSSSTGKSANTIPTVSARVNIAISLTIIGEASSSGSSSSSSTASALAGDDSGSSSSDLIRLIVLIVIMAICAIVCTRNALRHRLLHLVRWLVLIVIQWLHCITGECGSITINVENSENESRKHCNAASNSLSTFCILSTLISCT
jgi:hypothetical protein